MNEKNENIETLRHSASHVLAQAVSGLYPGVKLAIGPSTDDGFYYDFEFPEKISESDLARIAKEMKKIVAEKQPFERRDISRSEAREIFKGQPYKLELIEDIEDDNLSIYSNGDFTDLCRGPHVDNTSRIRNFKLLKLAGAYWRGSEKNTMLTRIYGTAFPTKEELKTHLHMLEEAKKRDHRLLGKELDLFSIHEEVGAGLIHWHPKGAAVRKIIEDAWKDEHLQRGYELVITPHIASEEIYRISGHLQNYTDLMYSEMDIEGRPFRVKPMNCPGHIMIYKTAVRSYRELPMRYAEMGTVYRFEKSGVLHGLMRVRGFTIDDAHIICSAGQVKEEVLSVLSFCFEFLSMFGFKDFKIYLSTRPPKKFVGSDEDWAMAESSLEDAMKQIGLDYEVDEGGGAFYGPKIDIKVKDSLNREWQCSTVQFDFNLPERFDMSYRGKEGEDRPYMVHRALLGSLERFFGILIEHYAGAFPLWLAPVQAGIIPISDKHTEYAMKVMETLRREGIRAEVDSRDDKMGKKIFNYRRIKVPYVLIVGDREADSGSVSVRTFSEGDKGSLSLQELTAELKEIISSKK
jgi:threonyl-tRNA synthetase